MLWFHQAQLVVNVEFFFINTCTDLINNIVLNDYSDNIFLLFGLLPFQHFSVKVHFQIFNHRIFLAHSPPNHYIIAKYVRPGCNLFAWLGDCGKFDRCCLLNIIVTYRLKISFRNVSLEPKYYWKWVCQLKNHYIPFFRPGIIAIVLFLHFYSIYRNFKDIFSVRHLARSLSKVNELNTKILTTILCKLLMFLIIVTYNRVQNYNDCLQIIKMYWMRFL